MQYDFYLHLGFLFLKFCNFIIFWVSCVFVNFRIDSGTNFMRYLNSYCESSPHRLNLSEWSNGFSFSHEWLWNVGKSPGTSITFFQNLNLTQHDGTSYFQISPQNISDNALLFLAQPDKFLGPLCPSWIIINVSKSPWESCSSDLRLNIVHQHIMLVSNLSVKSSTYYISLLRCSMLVLCST